MGVFLYTVTRRETGDKYVGISLRPQSRWTKHKSEARNGSACHFHRALAKYGFEAFEWKVVAELPTDAEAKIAERILIAVERPVYNMTVGGDGAFGCKRSPETCAKISANTKGKKTPEGLEAIRESNRSRRGRKQSAELIEKRIAPLRGRSRPYTSPEARLNMSLAQQGKKMTTETRAKMSAASIGRPKSPETRAKMKAAAVLREATKRLQREAQGV